MAGIVLTIKADAKVIDRPLHDADSRCISQTVTVMADKTVQITCFTKRNL